MKGFLSFIFVLALASLMFGESIADVCSIPDEICSYGARVNSFTRKLECCKGPGSSCGGFLERSGKCGSGLTCMCRTCSGCSTDTYECHQDERCKMDPSPHVNVDLGNTMDSKDFTTNTRPFKRSPIKFSSI